MKMSYMTMDGFFNRIDELKCRETQILIHKMVRAICDMRECEADASVDNAEHAKGIEFAADCFQEALEDYICAHSKHQQMIERPLEDPSVN